MDRLIRLKATTILVCSGIAFSALATTNTTTTEPTTTESTTTTTEPTTTTTTTNGTTAVKLSDDAILTSVQSALASYKNVNVTVTNGVVHLSGQLDSDTDYEKVVMLTESIQGIGEVNVDNLTVKDSKAPLQDTFITAKVKAALLQSNIMGKDVPAWSVSVETKDGKVYLSGTIASDQERQAILNVVKSVKGVTGVDDKMEVSGDSSTTTENGNTQPTSE